MFQFVGGDLEDNRVLSFTSPNPVTVYPGNPGTGAGFAFSFGTRFHPVLALEMNWAFSRHNTTHTNPAGNTTARFSILMFGMRGILPIGENLELFANGGIQFYDLAYSNNAIPTGFSNLSGSGFAAGLGLEILFGRWGVEIATSYGFGELDEVLTSEVSTGLPSSLALSVTTLSALLLYHF